LAFGAAELTYESATGPNVEVAADASPAIPKVANSATSRRPRFDLMPRRWIPRPDTSFT